MGQAKRKMDAIKSGAVEACGNCRFYYPPNQFCRRHAPTVILVGMAQNKISGTAD